MKTLARFGAASLALALVTLGARAADSGYVDFGKFTPAEGCEYVEVNVQPTLLKFAAAFADKDDAQAAALLRSLKRVRVNVVGYNDGTRADLTERVKQIRHDLEAQGWEQVVTARHGSKETDVAIYVKPHGDDTIDGLVVTVIDPCEKQAVFVNVVGNIKPDQLAALGKSLHIDPLTDLHVKLDRKHS